MILYDSQVAVWLVDFECPTPQRLFTYNAASVDAVCTHAHLPDRTANSTSVKDPVESGGKRAVAGTAIQRAICIQLDIPKECSPGPAFKGNGIESRGKIIWRQVYGLVSIAGPK
mmetsp:Transcript_9537/g.23487  ORF Transcript_9537/g.23487 Transcript_9537/m.23487 type:complete len:114 (+) Transcript_9537:193-534(+)